MRFLENSYRLLGLHPGAGPGLVRRAFRQAAQKCHPDLAATSDSDEFIRLRKAFNLALGYEEGNSGDRSWNGQGRGAAKDGIEERERSSGRALPEGLDLRLTLNLNRAEAVQGMETVVCYTRRVPCAECRAGCPGCRGLGWVMTQEAGSGSGRLVRERCPLCHGKASLSCSTCQGKGYLEEETRAHLLIPCHMDENKTLVMPGMGHRDPSGTGDLILDIIIG